MPQSPAALVHIEDDLICSHALREIVGLWPDVTYVGFAATAADGIDLCRRCSPDLVLLDVGLPDASGFDVVEALSVLSKRPRIVLLTGVATEAVFFRFINAGVAGVIWKGVFTVETLRFATAEVVAGRSYVSPEIQHAIRAWHSGSDVFFKMLSDREIELLPAFARGELDEEIAVAKGIGRETVHSHRKHILAKLNFHRTPELMRWAFEKGFTDLLRPPPPCMANA